MSLEVFKNRINLLPEHLVDQIKAGEVVERPANVLKELIENSIDANPSEIKITIENHGLDLIAIEDNGKGMFFDELPYAFCRHATSKISNFEDIYKLHTFGFRGEALASIASISRISCHSAPIENPNNGGKIVIHGARTIEHSPFISNEAGTSIFIKDLFFNTPVRLKFVKSKLSEKNALKRILNAFVITNPEIKFVISIDDEEKNIYPITSTLKERVESIFFAGKKNKGVLTVENSYLNNNTEIYISQEATKGNNNKHQYLFVNGRLFTDKKLHQIVVKNLEKFWGFGLSGHYMIKLKVPESDIDVNVHPNKTLIKFLNEFEVFSLVSACLKKIIETASISHKETSFQNPLGFVSEQGEGEKNLSLWQKIRGEKDYFEQAPEHSSISLGNTNLFSENFNERISQIGQNIFLLEEDNQFYFLNGQIIIKKYLEDLKISAHIESASLLISEPLNILKKKTVDEFKIIQELNQLGIEVDRIDETTIILRAIPSDLETFSFLGIVRPIISNSLQGNSLLELDYNELNIDLDLIHFLFKKYGLIEILKINAAKKITGSDIKTKFYAKK